MTRDDDLVAWSEVAQDDLQVAAARGHVDPAAWLAIVADTPPPASGPPRLLHGDFAAEHVLLAQDGTPTGVIDWSDAILGDPALDLAGLLHWGGAPLLAVACETYGPIDAATVARAKQRSRPATARWRRWPPWKAMPELSPSQRLFHPKL